MSGLQAVQEIGIEKYNEECRAIVMRYSTEWRQTIERLGRWIDFDNDYKVNTPIFELFLAYADTNYCSDHEPHIHGICLVGIQGTLR
jgi:hypothetical protein